ncbi:hypothetical protein NL676_001820 [Syzygium grande]|nr:hypothetical protein NL676_001820 [Syzygium grande]
MSLSVTLNSEPSNGGHRGHGGYQANPTTAMEIVGLAWSHQPPWKQNQQRMLGPLWGLAKGRNKTKDPLPRPQHDVTSRFRALLGPTETNMRLAKATIQGPKETRRPCQASTNSG